MSWNVSGVAQTPPSLDQSRCNLAVSTSAQSQRLSRSAAQSSSSDGTGNRLYWSIVTSCAYRAAASLPLSVEGFIWRGLGNQGLGSPRLLVWSSDASLVVQGAKYTPGAVCGARVDARAPRAVRRVCARTCARTPAGGGAAAGRGVAHLAFWCVQRRQFWSSKGRKLTPGAVLWGACRRRSTARIRLSGENFVRARVHERRKVGAGAG